MAGHCRSLTDIRNCPESGPKIRASPSVAMGRLCCKSLKTPGDKFPARSRNKPPSLIDVASGSLPKSPVSLSPGDEVPPHVYSKATSTARKICDQRCKKTFTTQSARSGREQVQQCEAKITQ